VTHNIPLLRDIVEEDRFRRGDITTKYLPEVYPEGFRGATMTAKEENELMATAAALWARKIARAQKFLNHPSARSTVYDPFSKKYDFVVEFPKEEGAPRKTVDIDVTFKDAKDEHAVVTINGKPFNVRGNMNLAQSVLQLKVEDDLLSTQIFGKKAGEITLIYKGSQFKIKLMPRLAAELLKYMPEKKKMDMSRVICAPMPGMIKSVSVEVGQMVAEGQELCVMEAMKMQNSLHAGKTAKVKAVNCKAGETVDEGAVLVELE
uniref:propionyl-CoA carboxylase n=1 Tax=Plectus sambesii TaxID=2011161 RepID=A0A914W9A9_9BILA